MMRLVYLTFIAFALCACNSKKQSVVVDPIPVKIQTAKAQTNVSAGDYVGTVVAESTIAVSFSVAGTVETVTANEGQRVKKGQLLARVDDVQLQNSYNAAKASLVQAEDAFKRMDILYKSGSLPEIKYVEVKSKLEQAQSIEAISRKNFNDCALYAPSGGIIGKRNIEPGMNVVPGAPAFTILKVDDIKVQFSVPEKEIFNLRIGQQAQAIVTALGDKKFDCVLDEKSATVNGFSHTYDVKALVKNPDKDLMPGMVCRVTINAADINKDIDNAIIVLPNNVVQLAHDGRRFVWLAVDGKATRRFVETGELTDYGIIVLSGIDENEAVIVEGYHKVSEGMKVEVI